ncbi:MBL fold metallo-hydrolase [Olivibacter domesticus]|uniref:Glyoxylase, beta-lactamase superfamily II n=1 Tax=Olivibacter domesticus TaxID=407022 RepID=A0A1H7WGR3_OLID1|nr:MBL fold metallo-hydrolase [Olivibacter domesticus]SEM20077.1 Glyoxylase, beta-lactamase superfamily II [Olivibacter domesticus]
MHIEQFYDTGLAHASYAILSNNEVVFIDPARNPSPYLAFARENHAKILGVIETHPHADFVSSHLEIHKKTGAPIYASRLVGAAYPHHTFDDGDVLSFGNISLKAINTPGHSPDSICVLVLDEEGQENALFTGDTLFVGDVGRPDLRENAGSLQAKAEALAKSMYHSLRNKIAILPKNVIVYPAHGPGSLCGKNMGQDLHSTIGRELEENHALQEMDEERFVKLLTTDQPFVPKYFNYDVALNRVGAENFDTGMAHIIRLEEAEIVEMDILQIDVRSAEKYRLGHFPQAINIPNGNKFETWLGSIVSPGESFYLICDEDEQAKAVMEKLAKIGYETQCKGYLIASSGNKLSDVFDLTSFKENPNQFIIIDIRNEGEVKEGKLFKESINIPLPRLRESVHLIPDEKPIVVHCAGGYRSAIGSSIIAHSVKVPVYDLSTAVNEFIK